MRKKDKRIDSYILKSADFAQPILMHIRNLVHEVVPDVEETMKWSFPHFDYSGEILCSMASFKKHCAFGFRKASIMSDPHKLLQIVGKTSMGSLGQLTDVSGLPSDKILKEYIKEAAKLNKDGVKLASRTLTGEKKKLEIPGYFQKALNKNKKALQTFEEFSPTNKRDYVEWLTDAKTEETRNKRLQTSIEWLMEGKIRNWKYAR